MKLIRIDQDVWKFLMKNAIPLEDTPNSALRRLLGIDKKRGVKTRRSRLAKGRTDQSAFLIPILEVLKEAGGSAEVKQVMQRLESKMKEHLKSVDYQKLKSGQVRWKNTVQWARNELVADGHLSKDSPRGVWEITEKGRERLKKSASSTQQAEALASH